jgi:hypothetical protein
VQDRPSYPTAKTSLDDVPHTSVRGKTSRPCTQEVVGSFAPRGGAQCEAVPERGAFTASPIRFIPLTASPSSDDLPAQLPFSLAVDRERQPLQWY